MKYALVTPAGAILQTGTCASLADIADQGGDGLLSVEAPDGVEDASHWYRHSTGEFVPYPPRPGPWARFDFATEQWVDPRDVAETLANARRAAIALVNRQAGAQRAQYITVIPGQDMVYQAKEAEALRYLSAAPESLDGYPLLAAEVGITAPDAWQLAQIWAHMGALWRGIAAGIEAARLSVIYQIETAPDEAAIEAIVADLG